MHNDWKAFSGLDRLANHWERPAWPDGAQAYYWLLPLGGASELRAQTQAFQEALKSMPDLDPVAGEFLHLTLYRIGTTSAVTAKQLANIAHLAAMCLEAVEPIDLSVGPLAGSTGAIRFSVTPWNRLVTLYGDLVAVTRRVLNRSSYRRADVTGLRPHVSIAYNARPRAALPIIVRVHELRGQPPVEVKVTDIEIVKLTRTGRVYRWTTAHRLSLADHLVTCLPHGTSMRLSGV